MGKKRASDGEETHPKRVRMGDAPLNDTPPGAQAPRSSTASTAAKASSNETRNAKKQKLEKPPQGPPESLQPKDPASRRQDRKKLSRLPPSMSGLLSSNSRKLIQPFSDASIAKRPLHHPAIPTPFASADHPKTLYVSHSTPFVPTLKRIRRLLLEISKRDTQSQAAQPRHRKHGRTRKPLVSNGRLAPEDVERVIAEDGRARGGGERGEEVYVKATGRAIERALRIGVHFQGESDCRVRVETGSVMAVDDIEVREDNSVGDDKEKSKLKDELKDEDVPETRVRMVSSVTVAVALR